jgi:hypothetical protein
MITQLIGHVGVDSGQLLLCDPCYIDSEWEHEDFEDTRLYENIFTKDVLEYRKDFINYQTPVSPKKKYGGMNMNELLATGEWKEIKNHYVKNNFSYNACAKATLSEDGHGQLNFKLGHTGAGVAFRTAFGDGMYPVIANYMDDGTLRSVEVVFQDEDVDDLDD